ncbi:MAG TPA: GWxTD domain-containing protein [Bacteroidales bacterium]|nr:GWxTD domain-containing protein [Bacteroidales bacterium]
MRFRHVYPVFSVFILLILLGGCFSQRRINEADSAMYKVPTANLSSLYNPSESGIHPQYDFYHKNDSITLLQVKVFTRELLFNQANPQNKFQARFKVHFQLYEIEKGARDEVLTDSATYTYDIVQNPDKKRFYATIPVRAAEGKRYKVLAFAEDVLQKSTGLDYLYIDKRNDFSGQNFNVISRPSGYPVFGNVLRSSEVFSLNYRKPGYSRIYISYYKNNQPLPPPVFSIMKPAFVHEHADSIWEYAFSENTQFMLPYTGMYHIRVDTTTPEGLTLYNFGNDFPQFLHPAEMLKPLAYLTSTDEYNKLLDAPNPKLALDEFWISTTGSLDAARELIRIYYNRAMFANFYFTADRQGWKTDRGMVYIIFGPPNNLYKTGDEETWVYFRKRGAPTLEFLFLREPSPFTNNLFELERDDALNYQWKRAVDSWRTGKPYVVE